MTDPLPLGGYHDPLPTVVGDADSSTPLPLRVRTSHTGAWQDVPRSVRSIVTNDGKYLVKFPWQAIVGGTAGVVLDSLDPPTFGDRQKTKATVTNLLTGARVVSDLSPEPMVNWYYPATNGGGGGPDLYPIGPSSIIWIGPPNTEKRNDWAQSRFWGPIDNAPYSTNYSDAIGFTSSLKTYIFNAETATWSVGPDMPDYSVNANVILTEDYGISLFRPTGNGPVGTHSEKEVYYQYEDGSITYWTPSNALNSTPSSTLLRLDGPNSSWRTETSPLTLPSYNSANVNATFRWRGKTLVFYDEGSGSYGWMMRAAGKWSKVDFAVGGHPGFQYSTRLDIRAVDSKTGRMLVSGIESSGRMSVIDWEYATTGTGVRFDLPPYSTVDLQLPDLTTTTGYISFPAMRGFAKDGRLWGSFQYGRRPGGSTQTYYGHVDFGWDYEKNEGVVSWVTEYPAETPYAYPEADVLRGGLQYNYQPTNLPTTYDALYVANLSASPSGGATTGAIAGVFYGEMPAYVPDDPEPEPEPEAPSSPSIPQLGAASSGIVPAGMPRL